MRKLLLTLVMLLVMSTSCLGANWEWVYSDSNVGLFYDKDSIVFSVQNKIVNRDKCVVWVKIAYDEAFAQKRFKQAWAYSLERWEFDFANNRMREGERLHYYADGQMASRDKPTSSWVDIAPDTFAELIKIRLEKYTRERTEETEQRTRNAH